MVKPAMMPSAAGGAGSLGHHASRCRHWRPAGFAQLIGHRAVFAVMGIIAIGIVAPPSLSTTPNSTHASSQMITHAGSTSCTRLA